MKYELEEKIRKIIDNERESVEADLKSDFGENFDEGIVEAMQNVVLLKLGADVNWKNEKEMLEIRQFVSKIV